MAKIVSLLLLTVTTIVLLSACTPIYTLPPKPKEPITISEPVTLEQDASISQEAPYGIRLGKTFVTNFYPGAHVVAR